MGTTAAWVDGHEWRALRSKRYTYALYRADRSELLFDNQADPYQMRPSGRLAMVASPFKLPS